jgi:hypothetical protein
MKRTFLRIFIILIVCVAVLAGWRYGPLAGRIVMLKIERPATVADRLKQYGESARERLMPYFRRAGIAYPPKHLVLLGLKQEKRLEVYAGEDEANLRFIRAYPIVAASGKLGPKLREGDRQVPEGLYKIESLNPNSLYHLSLRVNYPNDFDRRMARTEGRTNLGGDIMIHGSNGSVGCLAMGDPVSEELFILAAETGIEKIRVILAPVDFRTADMSLSETTSPLWVTTLYDQIRPEVKKLPANKKTADRG